MLLERRVLPTAASLFASASFTKSTAPAPIDRTAYRYDRSRLSNQNSSPAKDGNRFMNSDDDFYTRIPRFLRREGRSDPRPNRARPRPDPEPSPADRIAPRGIKIRNRDAEQCDQQLANSVHRSSLQTSGQIEEIHVLDRDLRRS